VLPIGRPELLELVLSACARNVQVQMGTTTARLFALFCLHASRMGMLVKADCGCLKAQLPRVIGFAEPALQRRLLLAASASLSIPQTFPSVCSVQHCQLHPRRRSLPERTRSRAQADARRDFVSNAKLGCSSRVSRRPICIARPHLAPARPLSSTSPSRRVIIGTTRSTKPCHPIIQIHLRRTTRITRPYTPRTPIPMPSSTAARDHRAGPIPRNRPSTRSRT
jgi:hypothetical protein